MTTSPIRIHAVITLTSPIGLLHLNKVASVVRVLNNIRGIYADLPVTIAVPKSEESTVQDLLERAGLHSGTSGKTHVEAKSDIHKREKGLVTPMQDDGGSRTNLANTNIVICDPTSPVDLAKTLADIISSTDALLIADASTPLTRPDQFEKLVTSFNAGSDAVRPYIAFTETLKIVDSKAIIKETLDRTSVKRIQSPEMIRCSVIDVQANRDFQGSAGGWSVPLKVGACVDYVEGIPEALRINTEGDRDLLESFLHWRSINA